MWHIWNSSYIVASASLKWTPMNNKTRKINKHTIVNRINHFYVKMQRAYIFIFMQCRVTLFCRCEIGICLTGMKIRYRFVWIFIYLICICRTYIVLYSVHCIILMKKITKIHPICIGHVFVSFSSFFYSWLLFSVILLGCPWLESGKKWKN